MSISQPLYRCHTASLRFSTRYRLAPTCAEPSEQVTVSTAAPHIMLARPNCGVAATDAAPCTRTRTRTTGTHAPQPRRGCYARAQQVYLAAADGCTTTLAIVVVRVIFVRFRGFLDGRHGHDQEHGHKDGRDEVQ